MAAALANSSSAAAAAAALSSRTCSDHQCSTSASFSCNRSFKYSMRSSFNKLQACTARAANSEVRAMDKIPPCKMVESAECLLTERPSFCLQPIFPFPESCPDKHRLDRWVKDAIVEIVKNLKDAPFLHFIFDSKASNLSGTCKVSKDLFQTPECWTYVQKSVVDVGPDGLILVRKLDEATAASVREYSKTAANSNLEGRCPMQDGLCLQRSKLAPAAGTATDAANSTDVWGLLVQGKNIMWSSCYILQTTRVAVSGGAACTRFCLTRAQCFGPSLQAQMERMWLL